MPRIADEFVEGHVSGIRIEVGDRLASLGRAETTDNHAWVDLVSEAHPREDLLDIRTEGVLSLLHVEAQLVVLEEGVPALLDGEGNTLSDEVEHVQHSRGVGCVLAQRPAQFRYECLQSVGQELLVGAPDAVAVGT